MSRVADALARAGAKRLGPSQSSVEAADLFPTERTDAGDAFRSEAEARPPLEPAPAPVEAPAVAQPRRAAPQPAPAAGTPRWNLGEPIRYRSAFREDLVEKLAIENGADSGILEEFRTLAATLHRAQGVHHLKVIMVTSAAGSEGKSLTAVNLALTLANSYRRRVLLVDGDLRKPTLHDTFQVQNSSGLLTFLKNGEQSVPGIEVSPRLVLMPSGGVSADPIGLLTSKALSQLLEEASQSFDWVILDSPPAAVLPDCHLLAPSVDGVLLIIDAFKTPHAMAVRAIEAVGRERILGVVLNHAVRPPVNYKYGYSGKGA
jgi:capsular exopolysaccharide synthesis family protein